MLSEEEKKRKKREYQRKWYAANKEKAKGSVRKYNTANKEKVRERDRKYREKNKEKILENKTSSDNRRFLLDEKTGTKIDEYTHENPNTFSLYYLNEQRKLIMSSKYTEDGRRSENHQNQVFSGDP